MSSILTNTSAMNALQTLQAVNNDLQMTQDRISSGLAISSGKDNAAYFSISQTMSGDSGIYKSIDQGMTLTQNSLSTAALGAQTVSDLASQFVQRVAFAQGSGVDRASVQSELDAMVKQIGTTIQQSTFNGNDLVSGAAATVSVVTGITRSNNSFTTTTISFQSVNLTAIKSALAAIQISAGSTDVQMTAALTDAQTALTGAIAASTSLGVAQTSVTNQQTFLSKLTDKLDSGVGNMIDANMEQEAAKLQSFQVQQQLATQSLSIANKAPQNLLSLFR